VGAFPFALLEVGSDDCAKGLPRVDFKLLKYQGFYASGTFPINNQKFDDKSLALIDALHYKCVRSP
jgi:hypothetical protein